MAKVSVREAAKRYNVSRPTLTKRLKNGEITGERKADEDGGGWLVDTSELIRAGYQARDEPVKAVKGSPAKVATIDRGLPVKVDAEIDRLKAELAEAQQRAAVAEALAEERGKRLDQMVPLLMDQREKPKRGWWPF